MPDVVDAQLRLQLRGEMIVMRPTTAFATSCVRTTLSHSTLQGQEKTAW
jgi:hypothetical protein